MEFGLTEKDILEIFDGNLEGYTYIEELPIQDVSNGKWSDLSFIFTCDKYPGKFFKTTISRHGSYHPDWMYNVFGVEVVKKEKTIQYWETINE